MKLLNMLIAFYAAYWAGKCFTKQDIPWVCVNAAVVIFNSIDYAKRK